MPKFLEKKLKAEYGAKSDIPYKVMNSIGAMSGPNETPKGAAMEHKHFNHVHQHLGKGSKTGPHVKDRLK
jgi:hypothetical protein